VSMDWGPSGNSPSDMTTDTRHAAELIDAAPEDAHGVSRPVRVRYSSDPRRRTRRPGKRAAASARRTLLTLVFGPVFLVWAVLEGLRSMTFRLERRLGRDQGAMVFRRPASMPVNPDQRSVADIVGRLQTFPFDPIPMSTHASFYREYGAESLGVLFSAQPSMAGLPHIYPAHFKPRLFAGHDGVQLAGVMAMHDTPGPALIIAHGLMTTKNFDHIRQMAMRAYDWGFHVVALDLRGWGQSSWTTDAPSSAGYYEGRDITAIARTLKQSDRVTSVGGLGYSLGGASMLNASHHASMQDENPLDGGVIALSAPTEIERALSHISTAPDWRSPRFAIYHMLQMALRQSLRYQGLDDDLTHWQRLVEQRSIPYYGLSREEFNAQASAVNWASEITVPTLQLHAADDFMVPVDHAFALRDAAADNPNVHVWVVDVGAHIAFTSIDTRWFHSVLRRWFEYWAAEG
jgi:predicted alpha/beta-fold hydrolase